MSRSVQKEICGMGLGSCNSRPFRPAPTLGKTTQPNTVNGSNKETIARRATSLPRYCTPPFFISLSTGQASNPSEFLCALIWVADHPQLGSPRSSMSKQLDLEDQSYASHITKMWKTFMPWAYQISKSVRSKLWRLTIYLDLDGLTFCFTCVITSRVCDIV